MLERLTTPILARAKSTGALVAALAAAIIGTAIATADQYMAVMLPGRSFKNAFDRRGLAPVVLSRTIGDVATPTSALIPRNSCGAYMAATLGVATFQLRALCNLLHRKPNHRYRHGLLRHPHAARSRATGTVGCAGSAKE